jgi:putative transposase
MPFTRVLPDTLLRCHRDLEVHEAVVRIPPRSPNLNAICERYLGSVRRECLDHIVIINETHLRRVLEEYAHGYVNGARPYQGIGQRVPGGEVSQAVDNKAGKVVALPVLGGLHHDYRRAA